MKTKIKTTPHAELPFKQDGSGHFLELMIAVSVFLFALTLAGERAVSKATDGWTDGVSGALTVQIKPEKKPLSPDDETLKINKIIQYFEQIPQVKQVSLVSDKQMQRLMQPWLGKNIDVGVLPLPHLLDVRLKNGQFPDLSKISQELNDQFPSTSIDNHRIWLSRLLTFSRTLGLLATSVLMLVLMTSAFSVVYATKTSLGIHGRIIEILHIIGATDDYIARQYARRNFKIGLVSGLLGLVPAALAVYAITAVAKSLDAGILSLPPLETADYVLFCALPLGTALLAMTTAYLTVKNVLGKIL
jgi:cell division transport system permease protein